MPKRGVARFGKCGKLSSRFIGPFEIIERVGTVAYRLALPPSMTGVHIAEVYWAFRDTREDRNCCVPVGVTAKHVRCPRGISRLHAPEVYFRSSSCGGLGTD